MGYSYNEYYDKYKDEDFKQKLNYYKTQGVKVDDDIWREFDNRGSEAAYAVNKKESCDEQIKRIKDEDKIGRISEELRMMIPKIAKARKERDSLYPWEFQKRIDAEIQLKTEHQAYRDKNRQRHKLKDDFKDLKEKSSKFEEQINTCESERKKIKDSVDNQIGRLNSIESLLEATEARTSTGPKAAIFSENPFLDEKTNKALSELRKSLEEARKIELHPNSSKIEELTQKLNYCLNLEAIKGKYLQTMQENKNEKDEKCNRYIEEKKSFDLNETKKTKSTKNKDDENER